MFTSVETMHMIYIKMSKTVISLSIRSTLNGNHLKTMLFNSIWLSIGVPDFYGDINNSILAITSWIFIGKSSDEKNHLPTCKIISNSVLTIFLV
jgi:hypothetical protein